MKIMSLFLMFALSFSAFAQEVENFNIPYVGVVKYQKLFEEQSTVGESMDSFVLRVAPKLRAYSDENGYEACGVIATNGETFSIIVGTNFANMVCVNSSRFVMEGHRHAGATLHSHGKQGRFRPTKTDLMLMESTFEASFFFLFFDKSTGYQLTCLEMVEVGGTYIKP